MTFSRMCGKFHSKIFTEDLLYGTILVAELSLGLIHFFIYLSTNISCVGF